MCTRIQKKSRFPAISPHFQKCYQIAKSKNGNSKNESQITFGNPGGNVSKFPAILIEFPTILTDDLGHGIQKKIGNVLVAISQRGVTVTTLLPNTMAISTDFRQFCPSKILWNLSEFLEQNKFLAILKI